MLRRLLLAAALAGLAAGAEAGEPADYVDPFIGTGGHGHTFPGPTLPFGMAQPGPDTRLEGWDGCSGYHDSDRVIYGFSHTHLSGTGIPDYGDVLLMPVTGAARLDNGSAGGPDTGYASRFDKSTERAGAGWYAVRLADYGVDVELTATERTGFHRYRFPAGEPAHVIVDLLHRDRVLDASLRVVGDREIEGHRRSSDWAKDQVVYFVARFSRPFVEATPALDDVPAPGTSSASGTNVKAVLSFGEGGGELLVQVGISAVDVAGARRNLDAELPGWDFAAVRAAARERWNEALGRVRVEGGSAEQRTIFYTALYHSLIAPNVYSDVDGRYRGMDGRIHRAEGRRHYTVFSLWDTFRATHPLFTLIEPERVRELIETMLAMYDEGGRLPVWELAANETDTMIGYHSVSVIADAWLKGIRGFDGERALEAMVASARGDRFGLVAYRRQGFVGAEDDHESVSKTLEYAYDDWCIARMAESLGRAELAEEFYRRSQGWRHLLDPDTGFMRARLNQRFVEPFDPRRVDNHYTEANAWQYSLFVPHDVESLIEKLGGAAAFVARLDALFTADSATTGREQHDITGLVGQYAHGNEPSHHMAWLYHYAGRPDRSAERVRRILDTLYTARPDGLAGNEDCGQMSSWYVLAAMGLYPVSPGSPDYVLAAPLFSRITVRPEVGRPFTIRARGAGEGRPYVRRVVLDGRRIDRSYVGHAELTRADELDLALSGRPDPLWGRASAARPPSRVPVARVPAVPFARAAGDRFRERLEVAIDSGDDDAVLRYSLDASTPVGEWPRYVEPLSLDRTTTISMVAEAREQRSAVVSATFHRIPHDWSVSLTADPAPQYDAGGVDALIDGQRGPINWRIGGWQGYRESDFEATVDLGASRPLHRVGAGFLQDVRAWIWMPAEVVVSVSDDGQSFRELARLVAGVAADDYEVQVRDVSAAVEGVAARWVRVRARGIGAIPDWHEGAGDTGWCFIDELLIE